MKELRSFVFFSDGRRKILYNITINKLLLYYIMSYIMSYFCSRRDNIINNCKTRKRCIQSDPFNLRHLLIQRPLTFLKIFLLTNFATRQYFRKRNYIFIVIIGINCFLFF